MSDILATLYPWTLSLHIMAVISWMAGLFYLPRLFVYHAEKAEKGDQLDQTLDYGVQTSSLHYGPSKHCYVALWSFTGLHPGNSRLERCMALHEGCRCDFDDSVPPLADGAS